jgi:hypothetical protein
VNESVQQTYPGNPFMPYVESRETPASKPDKNIIPSGKRNEQWNLGERQYTRSIGEVAGKLDIEFFWPVEVFIE